MIEHSVVIKDLKIEDCRPKLLETFNRYQEVRRCWRKENCRWILKDNVFTEQWDTSRKNEIIRNLAVCLNRGGIVFGAFVDAVLVGFASINPRLFGSNNEYVNLEQLHVSFEFRNRKIGRALFKKACKEAIFLGAKKLYISAHSSEETQAFYRGLGCSDALKIDESLFEAEPYDCHLEIFL